MSRQRSLQYAKWQRLGILHRPEADMLGRVNYQSAVPNGLDSPRGWQPSADDISAFTDARVAGLKAGLKLTPAQEKNCPIFEQAYRDLAKVRGRKSSLRSAGDSARDGAVSPALRRQRLYGRLARRG